MQTSLFIQVYFFYIQYIQYNSDGIYENCEGREISLTDKKSN